MRRMRLDPIDRQILHDLQDNGRMTNVELAERAGISAPPCLRRVRALEDNGLIKSYHAELSAEALGFTISAFVQVKLNSNSEGDLRGFEELVNQWPLVRECYMIVGDYDFVMKIVAEDWEHYQRFITNDLTAAPHVAQIKSVLGVRVSKKLPGVPIELLEAHHHVDERHTDKH